METETIGKMRNYFDAIRKLNSTQTGFALLRERKRLNHSINASAVHQMRKWVQCLGYSISDLDRLNIVHVGGTKGKGTACAYVNSILQKYRQSCGVPRKIGLYTSPHLITVRERIQINSEPISEEKFAKYFFETWDALETSGHNDGLDPVPKPPYFRFLTLMSFHVFLSEGIDTAIYEVGVGGEFDSTNIIEKPVATGITTLGIDHVAVLGDTIEEIAWHKAGIFKRGCPAYTVPQQPHAMEVLKKRAIEKGVNLNMARNFSVLDNINIKPAEHFQKKNASLAIILASIVLKKLGIATNCIPDTLPDQFIQGLENLVWRGRCETLTNRQQSWYLDGAHTKESLELACSWFGRVSQARELPCVLIFNQQSSRDAVSLLKTVHRILYNEFSVTFQYALFCTNITHKGRSYNIEFVNKNIDPDTLQTLTLQKELATTWQGLDPCTEVASLPSIEDAIDYVRSISGRNCAEQEALIFVTGSFHLVGGVLSILERQ
ncbi:Folylpolyglutamate synthetase [Coccidioides posadasii str. Silveira]|uniref:Folylpolyglutamate synthase n=1 Tax=Coccidioides posadasii (strain RMSCC 757 / Silveira) TaxID=443226 RepID=E9D1G7_COCPS|nr:tetrahydrofolylpolyglutamate synthase [Coccidioides posadasii str. Silveira]QVM13231.1 Folylpolyglutamate synthetase [Coccidioides posadasii str. Silveira]